MDRLANYMSRVDKIVIEQIESDFYVALVYLETKYVGINADLDTAAASAITQFEQYIEAMRRHKAVADYVKRETGAPLHVAIARKQVTDTLDRVSVATIQIGAREIRRSFVNTPDAAIRADMMLVAYDELKAAGVLE